MTTPIANVGLKGRLVGLFLVVGLVPLVTLGLVSRARTREALVDGARTKLEAIREVKTHQVEAWFTERRGDLEVLASTPLTLAGLARFTEVKEAEGLKSAAYEAVNRELGGYFKTFQEAYSYYDLFLIAPSGDVVYTVAREADWGSNLSHGP